MRPLFKRRSPVESPVTDMRFVRYHIDRAKSSIDNADAALAELRLASNALDQAFDKMGVDREDRRFRE